MVAYFTAIFYLLAVYKFINGMWLFQLEPAVFLTRFDGFTWLFMKAGLHQWLLGNKQGWIIFDMLFYSMPLIYLLANNILKTGSTVVAVLMLLVNWTYVQCYTLYPSNSIEAHTAWLLFPLVFLVNNPKTFALLVQGLRYFFLYVLVSAAAWKLFTGAVFNMQQMSGVLLYQHADLFYTSPGYWQTNMVQWLIKNEVVGFAIYLLGFLLELSFLVGFFTRKYDRWLVLAFVVFLVADHLVMRIPYYELLPFLITLRMPQASSPSFARWAATKS